MQKETKTKIEEHEKRKKELKKSVLSSSVTSSKPSRFLLLFCFQQKSILFLQTKITKHFKMMSLSADIF